MNPLLLKILKLVEVKAVLTKAKFVELKICQKISDFMKENFIEDLKYFEEKKLDQNRYYCR